MKNLIGKAARFTLLAAITSLPGSPLLADEGRTLYMANEGLLVEHGDTKVVFDPLFRNDYGQYLLLPPAMETALFAGEAPFDGIDAVFVSHFHGDHFSPADMLNLLESLPELQLYAPMQAVVGMRSEATAAQQNVFARVHSVSLEYGDAPVSLTMSGLLIEAVRIPHSGWPTGRVDVENIVWRVTLDSAATVAHLGDADPNDVHFTNDAGFWADRPIDMAFPPYWFYGTATGREILDQRLRARRSVGIHVPIQIPGDPLQRPVELRDVDLFTNPGETRRIEHAD
ncbi:MAG: MBL fold metallo-hydrolase [Gammaproteobacteria bacterium]